MSIYQDLVERHGFVHAYNLVKRFMARLKRRAPERFDVLEFAPAQEAQVDYGLGALTWVAAGKYRRPYLFVMTLKFSGKSFRKSVWKTNLSRVNQDENSASIRMRSSWNDRRGRA